MDKVLTLIVAATVLMIAAVTLIFSTTDSLGDFGNTADTSSQICDVYRGEYNDAQDEGDAEESQRILEEASNQGCAWA